MSNTNNRTAEVTVSSPVPGYVGYPHNPQHAWGAFAMLALEMGGYGDLEAVDPYNGRRLHLSNAIPEDGNLYTALRNLIDAMEQESFLGSSQ